MEIAAISRDERIAKRVHVSRSKWSQEERERRRAQAIRKQDEFLALLNEFESETAIRLAIADGEQPMVAPGLEGLEL